jgi:uncharacterized lipoprotein YajG
MTSTRTRSAVALLVALLALGGCASGTLDIGYPDTAANRALLAGVAPRRVVVAPVTDRRVDTSRIGARPEDGKALVTSRPVPDIVRDALIVEVGKNGHTVVEAPGDVVLAADVEEFWLDALGHSASTQYVGRVAIAVVVADGRTGDRLLTRRYVGIRRHTGEADSEDAWREVMDTALARTIHDVATDPELAMTVGRTSR